MSDENKPQPLTEEQRAEIRRRWSGVSLGEWSHGFDLSLRCNAITCDGQYLFLVVHPDLLKNESALEFLAHARQDMHALLQEVERLRAEVARLLNENEALKNSAFEFGVGFSTRVNEMRAREEWLAEQVAVQNSVYGEPPYCPMPGEHKCEWRQDCDLCGATIKARAECWRKLAEMETRENPGISGNFPENEQEPER